MASSSARLRALDEAMTPKPWASMRHEAHPEAWTLHSPDGETRAADGIGIATLRNALPAIIAVVDKTRCQRDPYGRSFCGECETCAALATLSQALEPGGTP